MTKRSFVLLAAIILLSTSSCFSQGEAGLPFLLISTSTESNGMGEASVAVNTDDPLAPIANPAQLGALSRSYYYSYGYSSAPWLPQFQMPDLQISALAFNVGLPLRMLNDNLPPLSVGFGYSRIQMDLGTFESTDAKGNSLGTYRAWESSDQFTLGVGVDSWVRASLGLTYKHVVSRLGVVTPGSPYHDGIGKLFDYGALVEVPIVEIVSRATDKSFDLAPNLAPIVDWSIGFSRRNLGQGAISYSDPGFPDPLPRQACAGMSVDLGIAFGQDSCRWNPILFKWTVEAEDILVTNNGLHYGYKGGLGDIKYFDEVILGNTNKETAKKKGWELTLVELFSIRGGRFEEDPLRGGRRLDTFGWGVRLSGIPRFLRAMRIPLGEETAFLYLFNHLDFRYNYSEWTTDHSDDPLAKTAFDSFSVTFSL